MRHDIPKFEHHFGPVDSPEQYVEWCVHQGRQLGKTTKLVESLPADEVIAIMLTHNAYAVTIKALIAQLRPDINIKDIKFVSLNNEDALKGFSGRVYVDNAVLDIIQRRYIDELNKYHNMSKKLKKIDSAKARNAAREGLAAISVDDFLGIKK